jgi:AcrR family transcriptional regulator
VTDTAQRPVQSDDRVPEILAAAEIVIDRLGHDKLSLSQIARVSLIPLARIYQYFADRNAVLGALSARALGRLSGSLPTRGAGNSQLDEPQRLDRVVDRLAGFLHEPTVAYLVLCGPFDSDSEASRLEAVHRLATALGQALDRVDGDEHPFRAEAALDYAAELVFACFRRSYLQNGRISTTAIEMAQHAVRSFVAHDAA